MIENYRAVRMLLPNISDAERFFLTCSQDPAVARAAGIPACTVEKWLMNKNCPDQTCFRMVSARAGSVPDTASTPR